MSDQFRAFEEKLGIISALNKIYILRRRLNQGQVRQIVR